MGIERMDQSMHTIVYVSAAKELFSSDELIRLLEQSRDNNLKFGVTGLLLYKSGSFMQAIEGPEEAIRRLYQNICADQRHQRIITLLDEPLAERIFPGWSMGFSDMSHSDTRLIQGYSDFLENTQEASAFHASGLHVKRLLHSFRRSLI